MLSTWIKRSIISLRGRGRRNFSSTTRVLNQYSVGEVALTRPSTTNILVSSAATIPKRCTKKNRGEGRGGYNLTSQTQTSHALVKCLCCGPLGFVICKLQGILQSTLLGSSFNAFSWCLQARRPLCTVFCSGKRQALSRLCTLSFLSLVQVSSNFLKERSIRHRADVKVVPCVVNHSPIRLVNIGVRKALS
jgi:hypothetical protein